MSRDCGGLGLCGKCRLMAPMLPVLDADRRVLKEAVDSGWRLACCHGLEWGQERSESMCVAGSGLEAGSGPAVHAALDIGTTTVVLALLDAQGKLAGEYRWPNPQRPWGADVLSRIRNWKQMPPDMIRALVQPHLAGIQRLVITGNTVMTHIWLGTDPAPLAQVPFSIPCPVPVITERDGRQEIVCAPFAPYVGADIRTGLQELLANGHKERFLYMDLGTNGELVWYDHGELTVCSTACGPALEGAGISVGMPAQAGAITRIRSGKGTWRADVIGEARPAGVCGSGLISWIDALVQQGLVTQAGKLKGCPEIAGLSLSQKDIRMFQLAKGALQAGWRLLMPDPQAAEAVYVAGGFSTGLDEDACIRLGLFHPAWKGKIRFCGNMALKGACRQAFGARPINLQAAVLELEREPAFSETFAQAMYLKPDRS